MKLQEAKSKSSAAAQRLKRLRAILRYPTANAFAAFLKVSPQRWNNFENGTPLSREVAFRLVQSVPGLTLDWLYFGKPDGLPLSLARELGDLDEGEPKLSVRRRP